MNQQTPSFGAVLKTWRGRRRVSQLDLALDAGISQRHLSFVETGRAAPSREMVLRLCEELRVPLRERNALLVLAGYAPGFADRPLDDPGLAPVRAAIELILKGHEPHPALAVDRHWTLVTANRALAPLLAGVSPALLEPPVNVLRLSFHPDGVAPRILNFREWRAHVIERLGRMAENTGDGALSELRDELADYPVPATARPHDPSAPLAHAGVAVPLVLASEAGPLSFLGTTTVFGSALDIQVSEVTIESFFPVDDHTAAVMRSLLQA